MKNALLVTGFLFPPLILLMLMVRYEIDFPRYDDWEIVDGFLQYIQCTPSHWGYFFDRVGNNLYILPKLYLYLLGVSNHWNLTYGIYGLWVCGVLILWCLCLILRETIGNDPLGWIFYPFASICTFSLYQWDCYFSLYGFCWFLIPLLLFLGMFLIDARLKFIPLTLLLILIALVGSLSWGTGIALWVVFPFFLLTRGVWQRESLPVRSWSITLFIVALGLTSIPYLKGYDTYTSKYNLNHFMQKVHSHSSPLLYSFQHPAQAIHHMILLLGSACGAGLDLASIHLYLPWLGINHLISYLHMKIAFISGLLALIVMGASLCQLMRKGFDSALLFKMSPWLTILLYNLISVAIITMARLGAEGFTIDHALSNKYSIHGLQFQLAAYVLGFIAWRDFQSTSSASFKATFPYRVGSFFRFLSRGYGRYLLCAGAFYLLFSVPTQALLLTDIQQFHRELQYEKDETYLSTVLPEENTPAKAGHLRLARFSDQGLISIAPSAELSREITEAPVVAKENQAQFDGSSGPGANFSSNDFSGSYLDSDDGGITHSQTLLVRFEKDTGEVYYGTVNSDRIPLTPPSAPSQTGQYHYKFVAINFTDFDNSWMILRPEAWDFHKDKNLSRRRITAIYLFHRKDDKILQIYSDRDLK